MNTIKDEYLELVNLLGGYTLKKTDSPSLSSHWLHEDFHLGVELVDVPLSSLACVVIIQVLCRQPYC